MTLPWIRRAPGTPYFETDAGDPWTPIGANDAISWFEFRGLLDRRDLDQVRGHLRWLAHHKVTVLRFMLEYAETGEHFFEDRPGHFNPRMVRIWDDLFALVEEAGLRVLLTPMDTYFHWVKWDRHPYNAANGGPLARRESWMVCDATRALIKGRLEFAARRWGGSGALFAWDIWNEMHPVQGEDRPGCFADYIEDAGPFLRGVEQAAHGRAHLQTVSVFGPELRWKPWLNEPVFRHPGLDFANSHFYEEGTIDDPADTVAPAVAVAALVREALAEIGDDRPFFDTEHGPIHRFKDHRTTLPEAFDDEYFRHIQWAHLASGGAGGGMRWPNRHPHALTHGMRAAQLAMARFLPLVDWQRFRRRPVDVAMPDGVLCFACADPDQAVLFLLRTQTGADGRVPAAVRDGVGFTLPLSGPCTLVFHDPESGTEIARTAAEGRVRTPPFGACLAVVIRR